MISPLQEWPVSQTGEFKQSLDSFYVTDSPLSLTNLAKMALFYYYYYYYYLFFLCT